MLLDGWVGAPMLCTFCCRISILICFKVAQASRRRGTRNENKTTSKKERKIITAAAATVSTKRETKEF